MSQLESRPTAGNWQQGVVAVEQQAPDLIIHLNGQGTLEGCEGCGQRISIQRYVTSVTVNADTNPTGLTATINMSIPASEAHGFYRAGELILVPGMEVNVYAKGVFPLKGLYGVPEESGPEPSPSTPLSDVYVEGTPSYDSSKNRLKSGPRPVIAAQKQIWALNESKLKAEYPESRRLAITQQAAAYYGIDPVLLWGTLFQESRLQVVGPNKYSYDVGFGVAQTNFQQWDEIKRLDTKNEIWWGHADLADPKKAIWTAAWFLRKKNVKTAVEARALWFGSKAKYQDNPKVIKQAAQFDQFGKTFKRRYPVDPRDEGPPQPYVPAPETSLVPAPSALSESPQDPLLQELNGYPYYQVMHGVVTSVGKDYGGGFYTYTLNANGLLHFWQYSLLTQSGARLAKGPTGYAAKQTFNAHIFTGMSPYAILYTLYKDVAGDPAAVDFVLNQKSNLNATSTHTRTTLYKLYRAYWERRFGERIMPLRMYGVSGNLYSSAQQALLWRVGKGAGGGAQTNRLARKNINTRHGDSVRNPLQNDFAMAQLVRFDPETLSLMQGAGQNSLQTSAGSLQAFYADLGQMANVNLFESTYQTKLDVMNAVVQVTGFEFYQDVDGDLVFKPPFYNLDTSASPVYRIRPIDIISFSEQHSEPNATFCRVTGSTFSNLAGSGVEGEFGVKSTFIDWKLVAQYGWREASLDTAYYSNPTQCFYAAVNRLALENVSVRTASLSIPFRPELRPGYPVYIEDEDCYLYIQSLAHTFSFGGQCTTSLSLVARRGKFIAPGNPDQPGIRGVDLSDTTLPPKPLVVEGEDGLPKEVGFPNVVMTLDPTRRSPIQELQDFGNMDLKSVVNVRKLIQAARRLGLVGLGPSADPNLPDHIRWEQGPYVLTTGPYSSIEFRAEDLIDGADLIKPARKGRSKSKAKRKAKPNNAFWQGFGNVKNFLKEGEQNLRGGG